VGKKTIESRWYLNKYKPWGIIKKGDLVYFKNSGELVIARAEVKKVVQFSGLNTQKVQEILGDYCQSLGIEPWDIPLWRTMLAHKKYGILLFLKNPKLVTPFQMKKLLFEIYGLSALFCDDSLFIPIKVLHAETSFF
jgi:hypothetical protein